MNFLTKAMRTKTITVKVTEKMRSRTSSFISLGVLVEELLFSQDFWLNIAWGENGNCEVLEICNLH